MGEPVKYTKSDRVEIYALSCPDSGDVRYIGKAKNSVKRFASHMRESRRTYPVYKWRDKLIKDGKTPVMTVIAMSVGDWRQLEKDLILQYKTDGARLLNVAEGGDEPFCSKEVRSENGRKVAAAIASDPMRKRIHEIKKYMCQQLKKGNVPDHVKAKLMYSAMKRPDLFGAFLKYL